MIISQTRRYPEGLIYLIVGACGGGLLVWALTRCPSAPLQAAVRPVPVAEDAPTPEAEPQGVHVLKRAS